ncbi:ATP-binding protein [Rugamonas sp. DEMB1]|uniref:sensor histidine kinase n=1 Tax=Rugamonas sp. DEMB1 TaxID=3039386 RepID=UPI00244CE6EC|nr:ATP-binding protein [Rugamonas sp. DEMB1]WGG48752.1 ATP-binding protein [Rugamonas sp. DEMB1]
MLRQVLINLLGNALKYSSRTPQAVVELGFVPDAPCPAYYVRDNGAGFDVANAKGLFEPFHRFHRDADFPGTGVGLAIVKRVVERHGGRLWCESRPGAGATFYFSLAAPVPGRA